MVKCKKGQNKEKKKAKIKKQLNIFRKKRIDKK